MSVLAMKVETADDVDGSDFLRVYTFSAPDVDTVTVVASKKFNSFEVGDVAAVAQVGSVLSAFDNMEISARKVFGVQSEGMAICPVDIKVGTELGDDFTPVS
jgi:tRNA-binding EMAP/Myf-like protein